MKPDFAEMIRKYVCHYVRGMPVISAGAAAIIAQEAFNAGLERAAEIAETEADNAYANRDISITTSIEAVVSAIRAEKEPQ